MAIIVLMRMIEDEHVPAYVGIWVLGDAGVEAARIQGAATRHQSGDERLRR